jgi:hypothetical protein
MTIMIVWKTVPGRYKTALEAFLRKGGPVPAGARTLGRWHVPGSILGWHLVEGDLTAVGQHVAEWADLLECEVYPVVDDAGAADAVKGMVGTE